MKEKKKSCMTCLWWGGEEADETAFCDEMETDTCGGHFCPKWHERPVYSDQITEEQEQELREMAEKGCTDSEVEDFCEKHLISKRTVFHQLAVWYAPKQCNGCEHVDMYACMPPCSSCARSHTQDHYSPESPETKDPLKAEDEKIIPLGWIREKIREYPGMESAMWAKLLRIWDAENKR